MKVSNFISNSGNAVSNQFIIEDGWERTYQSSNSIIAKKYHMGNDYRITLDPNFDDYSATTMKYLKDFLGHGIAETRKRIASGEYKLANLN